MPCRPVNSEPTIDKAPFGGPLSTVPIAYHTIATMQELDALNSLLARSRRRRLLPEPAVRCVLRKQLDAYLDLLDRLTRP